MPLPFLALAALGLGGAALLLFGGKGSAPAPGKVVTSLTKGQWYRLALTAPAGTSPDAMLKNLQGQGFFTPSFVTTSPTEGAALGYFQGATATHPTVLAPWKLGVMEQIVAPPQKTQATLTSPVLDPSMPVPTAKAVETAIATETSAPALSEFGATLLPDFPAASSILKTHAAIVGAPKSAPVAKAPSPTAPAAKAAGFSFEKEGDISTSGFFDDALHTLGHVAKDAGHVTEGVAKMVGTVGKAASGVSMVESVVHGVATGQPIGKIVEGAGKAVGGDLKTLAPYVESVVAVVPGIGSETASALAVGAALASGKNITNALIDAAAAQLPGGALAQEAFSAARTVAKGIATGQSLDTMATSFIRQHIPQGPLQNAFDAASALAHGKSLADAGLAAVSGLRSYLPPGPLQNAFDTGMALAHGQSLQQAGFNAVASLLPGTPAAQALGFAKTLAKNLPGPLTDQLEGALKSELTALGPGVSDLVHSAVGKLVSNPALAHLTSDALAKELHVLEPVARAALASVTVPPPATGPGATAQKSMVLVKTARLGRLLPGAPKPAPVDTNCVKYTMRVGPGAALQNAQALSARGDGKSACKAGDLARAALLVRRAQLVSHYLDAAQKGAQT